MNRVVQAYRKCSHFHYLGARTVYSDPVILVFVFKYAVGFALLVFC